MDIIILARNNQYLIIGVIGSFSSLAEAIEYAKSLRNKRRRRILLEVLVDYHPQFATSKEWEEVSVYDGGNYPPNYDVLFYELEEVEKLNLL